MESLEFNNRGEFTYKPPKNLQYTITTFITTEGVIIQKLLDEHMHELTNWIMNTRESQIRNALIELGWQPPE